MSSITSVIAAGFEQLDFHVLDSNAFAAGATGSVTAGAAGSPGGRIVGAKTMNITLPDGTVVAITGDDNQLGEFGFPSPDPRAFTIEYAVHDFNDDAVFQGTSVHNIGNSTFGIQDPTNPGYVDAMLLARSRSQNVDSANAKGFTGLIVPKCQLQPLGRAGFNERGEATFRMRVTTSPSTQYPWGMTFTDAVNGDTSGRFIPWTTVNPPAVHRFTQDGTGTTQAFGPLQYTPASTSTDDMLVFVNRYRTTAFTVNTATKMITFNAPPAADAVIVVWYEYTR